jgi:hypothetical protein
MLISDKTITPQARHRKQRGSENAALGGSSKSHSRTLASSLHIYSGGILEGSMLSSSLSLNELDGPKPSAFNFRS